MKCFYVQIFYPDGDTGWTELVDVVDGLAMVRFARQALGGQGLLRELTRRRREEVEGAFAAAAGEMRAAVTLTRACACGQCPPVPASTVNLVRIARPSADTSLVTSKEQLAAALGVSPASIVNGIPMGPVSPVAPSTSSAISAVEMPAETADRKKKPALLNALLDKAAAFALALLGSPQPRKEQP